MPIDKQKIYQAPLEWKFRKINDYDYRLEDENGDRYLKLAPASADDYPWLPTKNIIEAAPHLLKRSKSLVSAMRNQWGFMNELQKSCCLALESAIAKAEGDNE